MFTLNLVMFRFIIVRQKYTIKFNFKELSAIFEVCFAWRIMKIAVYVGKDNLRADCRIAALEKELREAGCDIYTLGGSEGLQGDTDYVMSVGGDGTFLSAAMLVADSGIPVQYL